MFLDRLGILDQVGLFRKFWIVWDCWKSLVIVMDLLGSLRIV